ncbi:MAG: type II secretion system protein [Bdellovibrionales bacterium]|nr:type II secretion system protein [Bdellovibrionales bacterium]
MLRCDLSRSRRNPRRLRCGEGGFTLVEIILVIILFVFMSGLVVTRFDTLMGWRQRGDLRKLVDTWEFLYSQALSRNTGYQLRLDIDKNAYRVLREVVQTDDEVHNVDYLANLRTEGEKKRREAAKVEDALSLEEEYAREDLRQTQDLETLFYQEIFADPNGSVRLGRPIEFPKLADEVQLAPGISIRDVRTLRGEQTEGTAYIRFSPRGAAEFAVIHLEVGDQIYTAMMNPSTGKVLIENGDKQYEWLLDDKQTS